MRERSQVCFLALAELVHFRCTLHAAAACSHVPHLREGIRHCLDSHSPEDVRQALGGAGGPEASSTATASAAGLDSGCLAKVAGSVPVRSHMQRETFSLHVAMCTFIILQLVVRLRHPRQLRARKNTTTRHSRPTMKWHWCHVNVAVVLSCRTVSKSGSVQSD